MAAEDLNDIRLALHALGERCKQIDAKLERLQPLMDFSEVCDGLIEALPGQIEELVKRIESDPMLGPFLAPMLTPTLRAVAEKHRELTAS